MPDKKTTRRKFLETTGLVATAAAISPFIRSAEAAISAVSITDAPFTLPTLSYDYKALEPHIDAQTMEIHHSRHHKAYVDKLNDAIIQAKLDKPDLDTLMRNISKYSTAIRNNGGGHWNHSMFWQIMKPGGGGAPSGDLATAINTAFGSFDEFKTKFNAAAMSRFGSGWAWLVVRDGKLEIGSTPNQDNPLMDVSDFKGTPLLALDVWEHAYYLKYQNKRADYVQAWWNLIHWDEVTRRFKKA